MLIPIIWIPNLGVARSNRAGITNKSTLQKIYLSGANKPLPQLLPQLLPATPAATPARIK